MPYTKQESRLPGLETADNPKTAGELAYAVARLMDKFVAETGGLSWDTICLTIRAVTGTADEFRRRFQDRYEGIMLITNGEVFPETKRLFGEKLGGIVRSLRKQAKEEEEEETD